MWEDPDETGGKEPLNSDDFSLPVKVFLTLGKYGLQNPNDSEIIRPSGRNLQSIVVSAFISPFVGVNVASPENHKGLP